MRSCSCANEYLVAENRVLRNQLQGRLRLTDGERRSLAEIGKRLGKQALDKVASIVNPDTGPRLAPEASCPKTQTNSRLARRAVSIVIAPWRAPDLGRVGGDVGDSGSPHAQGKTPSSNGIPRSRAETWIQARAAPGPERASPLRHGSPGLDSGPLGWPLFRRCTALSAAQSPPLAQTWHSKIGIRDENRK